MTSVERNAAKDDDDDADEDVGVPLQLVGLKDAATAAVAFSSAAAVDAVVSGHCDGDIRAMKRAFLLDMTMTCELVSILTGVDSRLCFLRWVVL